MRFSHSVAFRAVTRLFLLLALPVVALSIYTTTVSAQAFAMMEPAAVLNAQERAVSGGAFFDDELWGVLGMMRDGFGGGWDAGFQLGVSSYDDTPTSSGPTTWLLSFDGRRQVRWAAPSKPVDATIGLAFGVEAGRDFTRLIALPQAQFGHRISYDQAGRSVTPYGSLGLGIQRLDTAGFTDTDFDLQLRIGGLWQPSPGLGVNAEFGFGSQNKFLAGVRWPF